MAGIADLEHFNIFCSYLGRREDKAGKEENATLLIVGWVFLEPAAEAAVGIKRTRKIKLLYNQGMINRYF